VTGNISRAVSVVVVAADAVRLSSLFVAVVVLYWNAHGKNFPPSDGRTLPGDGND
jgi:hypothetical protein